MLITRANPSTQQTNAVFIPAKTNGLVKVRRIYLSSDTELTVTLVNSETHDVVFRIYVGARGGVAMPVNFWSAWGEGLDLSTSGAGNVYIAVEYLYN